MSEDRDPAVREERFYHDEPGAPAPNRPISPGVSAVVFDADRRILCLKRSRSRYWSLPGGRMDNGESAQACCIRETLEETGLVTTVTRLISITTSPGNVIEYPDGNIYQSFVLCFEAQITGGALQVSDESESFRWLGRGEIDTVALLPDSRQNALDAWTAQDAAFIR